MQPDWENLFNKLVNELGHRQALPLPESDKAESCFRLALQYWYQVKESFLSRVVHIDQEEIEFFKRVKPRFTAYIEYYLIINQSLLFIPEEPNEKLSYWKEEEKRYPRFYDRHRSFIMYYLNGFVEQDAGYFLQRNNHLAVLPQERIYEDWDCRSSHDHLVRGILANRIYKDYVEEKLDELKQLK